MAERDVSTSEDGSNGVSAKTGVPELDYGRVLGMVVFVGADGGRLAPDEFTDLPKSEVVPGQVCRAARNLLLISQAMLSSQAKVSKKTVNDYENALSLPKPAILERLRVALEASGARFVVGADLVGVTISASRQDLESRSRSPSLAPVSVAPTRPGSRPRGRPRNPA